MVTVLYVIFIICLFAPVYTYAVYPLILRMLPARRYRVDAEYRPTVSVLVAAYNEEKVIADRIKNLLELNYPQDKLDIYIGSDGSTDKTVEIAKSFLGNRNLHVLDLPRGGKTNTINSMLKQASGDIIVFSDANTLYHEDAIVNLVKHFVDDRIGCVSGQLRYKVEENAGYGAKSESTYWKYENWVKIQESKIGRLSGANGAIYAIRKGILSEIEPGIINDDFYVSTYVMQAGFDVIIEPEAIAYEEPNDDFNGQFERHIRDGAGHYQAMRVFWRMLFPRKGSFTYISHRVIKWLVPFFLPIAYICNLLLITQNSSMFALFVCQTVLYLALGAYYILLVKPKKKLCGPMGKLMTMAVYFMSVNLSLLLGYGRLITKRQKATWNTQR